MTSLPAWVARVFAPIVAILLISAGAAAATGSEGDATPSETTPPTFATETEVPTTDAETPPAVEDETTDETVPPTTPAPDDETPEVEDGDANEDANEGSTEPVDCASARNHGEYVSSIARNTPEGPNRGAIISEAAKSDCGKKAKTDKSSGDKPGNGNGRDKADKAKAPKDKSKNGRSPNADRD